MPKQEKILITGATGFIGSRVVRRLAGEGCDLVCLTRGTPRPELSLPGVVQVVGDLTDLASIRAGMAGCSRVVHLAGLYSMWRRDPQEFERVNVEGTRNVLRAAVEQGTIDRLVNVSTVAVYGLPRDRPFREESPRGTVFFSQYARTKALADQAAWACASEHSLPLTALYPGIVLGAGDYKATGRYMHDYIFRRIPSTIFHNSWATYVWVEDVAEAVFRALWAPAAAGQRYLVGGTQLSGREYSRLIQKISGTPAPPFRLPDWMVMTVANLLTFRARWTGISPRWGLSVDAGRTLRAGFYFDGTKIQRELGLVYTPIEVAIREAVEDYRRSPGHSFAS
ncbi:MAG TPA: NAD-dependent epimerase/dehydratase family protein [Anaerolineaceae bacterium]|nr:NAD-dependent epimerase/dehydratase family protein [Anaerolineaceae bacterium]